MVTHGLLDSEGEARRRAALELTVEGLGYLLRQVEDLEPTEEALLRTALHLRDFAGLLEWAVSGAR